jgi:hypothetical protein
MQYLLLIYSDERANAALPREQVSRSLAPTCLASLAGRQGVVGSIG